MHIRLPSSAPRRHKQCYVKLLSRVRLVAQSGFDFEGRFLRVGGLVDELELLTSRDYPGEPVLLECAGIAKAGRGHVRSELLYILWQWDRREWRELARATSASWDWAADLAPIAHRAMGARNVDIHAVATRLSIIIDAEMSRVPENQRAAVAAIAHDALAAELYRA